MTVTLFKNLFDNKPYYIKVDAVLQKIKNGSSQPDLIKQIRATTDKESRNELKKQLGVVCFSGKFSERKATALEEYSKIVVLDFDNVANVKVKKQELALLPYVYSTFTSPSGDGVKALVRVSSDNHLGHYKALAKELEGVDPSGKDVVRACFISMDENIYINDKSDIYTKLIESAYTDVQKLEKLKKWLDGKGEQFVSGNRNSFVAKLSGASNRFGIDHNFVTAAFIKDYSSSDFSSREIENVVRGIYRNYAEQNNTASFDESFSENRVNDILSAELKTNDVIYLGDVEADMIKEYHEGVKGAPSTHFPGIDLIYRPMPGDLNVLSGHGNHGKTSIKKQLDVAASIFDKRKHAWFANEEFPPQVFYNELVRTVIGKPLEATSKNRMTLAEFKRGMEFVKEHFIFIYPKTSPTPDYLMERFAEVIIKHGVNSITIDPFNMLVAEKGGRDDVMLAETLTKFERFAQNHLVYTTIITHPKVMQKNSDGNYPAVDVYDLNGGAVWSARSTNIVVYNRPFFGTDRTDPTCEFISRKIKRQTISGLPGTANLTYDRTTGRYLDNNYNPLNEVVI